MLWYACLSVRTLDRTLDVMARAAMRSNTGLDHIRVSQDSHLNIKIIRSEAGATKWSSLRPLCPAQKDHTSSAVAAGSLLLAACFYQREDEEREGIYNLLRFQTHGAISYSVDSLIML